MISMLYDEIKVSGIHDMSRFDNESVGQITYILDGGSTDCDLMFMMPQLDRILKPNGSIIVVKGYDQYTVYTKIEH